MFSSIQKVTLLFTMLLASSEAVNQLCRTCLNGKVTFGLESDTYGAFVIQTSGDCNQITSIKTPDGVTFADFGNDSHEFSVSPSDDSWVLYCDLGTKTSGCCELS
ncbi:hypothetical protein K501DRAFT_286284 [Backusella circina FSU 941]|nr:hypothetical protein K501DRAFT_286284 [Backusella circina FSU 941]